MNSRCIVVISGPSGAGKATVIAQLCSLLDIKIRVCVSATTRLPRPSEVDGKDYHFLSREEFLRRVEKKDFLEHEEYVGNYYGTLRSEVESPQRGVIPLLEIEVQGFRRVRPHLNRYAGEILSFFLMPPSMEELKARLQKRGDLDAAQITARLARAEDEMKHASNFTHTVVNHDVERAAAFIVSQVRPYAQVSLL